MATCRMLPNTGPRAAAQVVQHEAGPGLEAGAPRVPPHPGGRAWGSRLGTRIPRLNTHHGCFERQARGSGAKLRPREMKPFSAPPDSRGKGGEEHHVLKTQAFPILTGVVQAHG